MICSISLQYQHKALMLIIGLLRVMELNNPIHNVRSKYLNLSNSFGDFFNA